MRVEWKNRVEVRAKHSKEGASGTPNCQRGVGYGWGRAGLHGEMLTVNLSCCHLLTSHRIRVQWEPVEAIRRDITRRPYGTQ
jgi:hypothetical protein